MSADSPIRLVLGPQRPSRNIDDAMLAADLSEGSIATITAGWQEAENDLEGFRETFDRPLVDLRLYGRAEEVFSADERLAGAHRERQNRLKE